MTSDIIVTWNGTLTRKISTGWTEVVASPTHLIAVGEDSYGWFDGTWHDVAIATPATLSAATTSTGLIYTLHAGCVIVQIVEATGAQTTLPLPVADSCGSIVTMDDQLYVSSKDDYFVPVGSGGSGLHVEGDIVSEVRTNGSGIADASAVGLFVWNDQLKHIRFVARTRARLPNKGL